jgi:hypothetical protein
MRPERFPKRRPDGSFCIEQQLSIDSENPAVLATRINDWIEEWVLANRYWECKLAETEGGALDFYDEFARPPYCVAGDSGSFLLRVEGCPGAKKLWKDWLLSRLMKDLVAAFKELKPPYIETVRNCQDHESTEPTT